jgi:hypothetical protein
MTPRLRQTLHHYGVARRELNAVPFHRLLTCPLMVKMALPVEMLDAHIYQRVAEAAAPCVFAVQNWI